MISTDKCKAMAKTIVNNVKDVLADDYDEDDMQSALSSIDKFILSTKGHENMALSAARKALTPLRNTLLGILDEHKLDDVSLSAALEPHSRKIVEHCNTFIAEVKEVLTKKQYSVSASPKSKHTSYDADAELKRQFGQKSKEDIQFDKEVDILLKYLGMIRKLPKNIDTDSFSVIKAPVIPLFNKTIFKFDEHLKKAHITYDQLDFYFILKNQVLIAIDSGNDEHFIIECLKTINESGNTQYELVSTTLLHHPNANVKFAWIMEKGQFNKLTNSTGTFSVKRWAFPEKMKK